MGVSDADVNRFHRYLETMAYKGPYDQVLGVYDSVIDDDFNRIQYERFDTVFENHPEVDEREDIDRFNGGGIKVDRGMGHPITYIVSHGELYYQVLSVSVTEQSLIIKFDLDYDLVDRPDMYEAIGKVHELACKQTGRNLNLKVKFQ